MNIEQGETLVFPPSTKRIQEWLSLRDFGVAVDGVDGPATQAAIRSFQARWMIHSEQGCGEKTWKALRAPMYDALKQIIPDTGQDLRAMLVRYARQHLDQHPREVGGQNKGPWVRLYMNGNEGAIFPWCAGFVCFCLQQATSALDLKMPFEYSFGCDFIARQAKIAGCWVDGQYVKPDIGWLFLVKRKDRPGLYSHIGIVMNVDGVLTFRTVEGNTNDDGSPEGYEVCSRTRLMNSCDFVKL